MGIKSRDWKKLGDYISQIKSEGLSFVDGAKQFASQTGYSNGRFKGSD